MSIDLRFKFIHIATTNTHDIASRLQKGSYTHSYLIYNFNDDAKLTCQYCILLGEIKGVQQCCINS